MMLSARQDQYEPINATEQDKCARCTQHSSLCVMHRKTPACMSKASSKKSFYSQSFDLEESVISSDHKVN